MVEYFAGVLAISNIFLALVAGAIAITLFKPTSKKHPLLRPWRYLLAALLLFIFIEIVASLRAFNIAQLPWTTHITASVMVILIIGALLAQLEAAK